MKTRGRMVSGRGQAGGVSRLRFFGDLCAALPNHVSTRNVVATLTNSSRNSTHRQLHRVQSKVGLKQADSCDELDLPVDAYLCENRFDLRAHCPHRDSAIDRDGLHRLAIRKL